MQPEFLNDEHSGKKAILEKLEHLRKIFKTACLNNCYFPKLKCKVLSTEHSGETRDIKKSSMSFLEKKKKKGKVLSMTKCLTNQQLWET